MTFAAFPTDHNSLSPVDCIPLLAKCHQGGDESAQSVSNDHSRLEEMPYPKIPTTPSFKLTKPRFVAGIQKSRRSTTNWNRVSALALYAVG